MSKREGPWRAGRRKEPARRKWAITGLESALPRAPSVGGFESLPVPLCLPSPLRVAFIYIPVPRRQLAPSKDKGVVLPIFFLFCPKLFQRECPSRAHTVIKREGGLTPTVHYRTQRVDWTLASSPLGSWL